MKDLGFHAVQPVAPPGPDESAAESQTGVSRKVLFLSRITRSWLWKQNGAVQVVPGCCTPGGWVLTQRSSGPTLLWDQGALHGSLDFGASWQSGHILLFRACALGQRAVLLALRRQYLGRRVATCQTVSAP